jgi:hypothetical protein
MHTDAFALQNDFMPLPNIEALWVCGLITIGHVHMYQRRNLMTEWQKEKLT